MSESDPPETDSISLLEQRASHAEAEVARLEGELVTRSSERSANEHAVWRQELESLLAIVEEVPPVGPSDQELEALRRQAREAQATVALLKIELKAEAAQAARLASDNARLRLKLDAYRRRGVISDQLPGYLPASSLPLDSPPPQALDDHRELQRQAFEDPITNLPKFQLGHRYLQLELQKAARGLGTVALSVIDIDQLRSLNVHLGRDLGDSILRQMPARLLNLLKPEDVLVRGQDDEFWIITPIPGKGPLGLKTVTQRASTILTHFLDSLKSPFIVEGHKLQLTAACGLTTSQGKEDSDLLIERALLALKSAKGEGRNRAALYQPEMESLKKKGKLLLPALRQALETGQFCLRFQPIYDLKSQEIWGVESLLRWNHPVQGLLEPATFHDAACETGIIVQLGDWVVKEHCRLAKGLPQRFVSLNVSAQELIQADFVRKLTRALESARIARPDLLIVEVSEFLLVGDNERLAATLRELRRWNVQVAIDDFSFDTVSVGRLKKLNVNYLKFAPSLVGNLDTLLGRNMVDTALAAAENLGCKAIATGIEIPDQLDTLLQMGCPLGQGAYLCPPVPPGNLVEKGTFRRPDPPRNRRG